MAAVPFHEVRAASQSQVLETVTVTAQKRDQNPQEVGISITALSGDQLNALGYTSAQEVANFAPGVVSVQPNGEGNYSFAIRGVANNDLTTNRESPVAVYVDQMYISQMSSTGFLLFDIDTVEILRGPQGTLFGRNATGGLVHYRTKKPSQQYEAYGRFTYGEFDQVKAEGAINVPLGARAAARLSVATNQSSGYVENRVTPTQNLNNANDYAGRLQLAFDPTDRVSVLLNLRGSEQDIRTGFFEYRSAVNGGGIFTPGVPNPTLGGYVDTDDDDFAGDYDFTGHNIAEYWGASSTITWDVGNFTVTSLTDFQHTFRDYIEDTDASPVNYYNYFQTNDADQFSQELRISTSTDRWDLVGGAFYLDLQSEDSTGGIAFVANEDDPNVNGNRRPSESETESFSIFGQAEYMVNDKLTLIGGLRWIDETKDFVSAREAVLFPQDARSGLDDNAIVDSTVVGFDPEPVDEQMWAARLQANYMVTPTMMTYLSYNRGVRSGGFSQPPSGPDSLTFASPELLAFDPETLHAYEIGTKWDPFERLRVNAAVYYYDYKDYQAYTNFPGQLGSATMNGKAKNRGFEVELQGTPLERLDMRLGVGYTDVGVEDIFGFEGQTVTSVNTPKWNINGLVRYAQPIGNGELVVQADATHQSEHYFSLDVRPATTEEGYTVANALVGWYPNSGQWSLMARVNNVFDERYKVQTFDLSDWIGMVEDYYGKPRWASVTLEWNL